MKITVSIGITENEKFLVNVSSVDDEIPDYSNARRYTQKAFAFDNLAEVNEFVGKVFAKDG